MVSLKAAEPTAPDVSSGGAGLGPVQLIAAMGAPAAKSHPASDQRLPLPGLPGSRRYRVVHQQVRLGVFDPVGMNPYDSVPPDQTDTPAHRQLAREAAAQSAVLLANKGGLLPLDLSKLATVAVIGPSANDTAGYDRCFEGGTGGCLYSHIYRGYSSFVTTPLMGIVAAAAGAKANVTYQPGCGSRFPHGRCSDPSGIPGAVAAAAAADVAIVVVGLDESYEEEGVDRMDPSATGGGNGLFQLPGHQQDLIDQVVATGTPVVQVLLNGGPLSLHAPTGAERFALIEAFYGGQACGDGIADVLFGKAAPGGKMPVTAYASTAQAGNITDMDMSKGRTYRYLDYAKHGEPAYPFGFGLSYTTWAWAPLGTNASGAAVDEATPVALTVTVRNTGPVASAQVVQLYASLSAAFAVGASAGGAPVSAHVPPRQLVAFEKVFVPAGRSATVTMVVVPAELAGWGLWHAKQATLHFAAGGVSPTPHTLATGQLVVASVAVSRARAGEG